MFDGTALSPPTVVVIEGDSIGTDPAGAVEVDGNRGSLLPGLIDAQVHLTKLEDLRRLAKTGITTAMDIACWPPPSWSTPSAIIKALRTFAALEHL